MWVGSGRSAEKRRMQWKRDGRLMERPLGNHAAATLAAFGCVCGATCNRVPAWPYRNDAVRAERKAKVTSAQHLWRSRATAGHTGRFREIRERSRSTSLPRKKTDPMLSHDGKRCICFLIKVYYWFRSFPFSSSSSGASCHHWNKCSWCPVGCSKRLYSALLQLSHG